MFLDVLWDAFKDTLLIFPFLLLIYILIEMLEHRTTLTHNSKVLQGKLAPLIGSATGIIPQCGFSVMAAKLYEEKYIRTGTLLAVFIATSDEALIILLSEVSTNTRAAVAIMPLIIIKIAVAVGVGYLTNFLLSGEKTADITHPLDDSHGCSSCGREHEGKSDVYVYFISPLLHSLKIALYLFIVNLVFGYIIEAIGEETIADALIGGVYWQPFITALIGLIPNCASSVILTGAYASGGIMFGSMVAGLCPNAGLGLMVLLKNGREIKRNVLIILVLYFVGAVVGLIINIIASACGLV